jgi:hypothetical protein
LPNCIAKRFNVDLTELLTLNSIDGPVPIAPGLMLKIPKSGKPYVGNRVDHAHPATYIVRYSNETIYSIACYFGDVYPETIALANKLEINNPPLNIGQELLIP